MKRMISFVKRWAAVSLLICPFSLFGQTEQLIRNDIDSMRAGGKSIHDYQINASNERSILQLLKTYEKDPNSDVRSHVRYVRAKVARVSTDTLIRQQIVESFVEDCLSPDPSVSQYVNGRLQNFDQPDFSPRAKQLIVNVFNKGAYENRFLLVCGVAQVKQLMPALKKIAVAFNRTQEGWARTTAWFAVLALTRMGDQAKVDEIISAVELELNATYRVGTLLQYVAYTRHPDCIRLLQKYLESSERGEGLAYNRYALGYLAKYLPGFPVEYKTAGYTDEELQLARDYLKNKWQKK